MSRPVEHNLDLDLIDGVDEIDYIDCDEQLALVWCRIHGGFEWHWIPYEKSAVEDEEDELDELDEDPNY